ncbi:MAG TPA: septum site-determining protein MinC [Clostridiales bacterium]|nr:septum site-determining protein MinC [Clostridiales bacterium]
MLEGGPLRSDRIPAGERTDGDTLLVRKTLRSGQHVGHRGNVVVLGDVNPGAEVVAAGDILVLGALRGVAHAGARGDEQALVAGFRLRPTQLRIGTHIARAPDGDITGPEQPEVALVNEGRVVIRPYCPTGRDRAGVPQCGGGGPAGADRDYSRGHGGPGRRPHHRAPRGDGNSRTGVDHQPHPPGDGAPRRYDGYR